MKASYNYREISDRLSTSGSVIKDDLLRLYDDGYGAVINLLPDAHERAIKNEKEIVERQGLKYIHIPVDFSAPKNEDYEQFKRALDDLALWKTHIHCAANWRVSAFYGVYAYEKSIWRAAQAWEHIASLWTPSEYPAWFHFLRSKGVTEES